MKIVELRCKCGSRNLKDEDVDDMYFKVTCKDCGAQWFEPIFHNES